MKVLVACEFSGIVRDAFIERGHDAISVDLLETERPGPHIVGDALEAVRQVQPDLLIAHPPCTYLANSGVRWLYGGKGTDRDPERWSAMYAGAEFFAELLKSPVDKLVVENPIMHRHARETIIYLAGEVDSAVQTIQPWQFGHPETKATQLWLRGLPPLRSTEIVTPEWAIRTDGTTHVSSRGKHDSPTHYMTRTARRLTPEQARQWRRIHREPPGPNRWKNRSRTYPGIAAAMAEQWGSL